VQINLFQKVSPLKFDDNEESKERLDSNMSDYEKNIPVRTDPIEDEERSIFDRSD